MKLEIPDDTIERGIAAGVAQYLASSNLGEQIAEALLAQLQFLTPEQAAAMLQMPERTFSRKVNEERLLTKVTMLGGKEPRYLLGEICERALKTAVRRAGLKPDEAPKIVGLPARKEAA